MTSNTSWLFPHVEFDNFSLNHPHQSKNAICPLILHHMLRLTSLGHVHWDDSDRNPSVGCGQQTPQMSFIVVPEGLAGVELVLIVGQVFETLQNSLEVAFHLFVPRGHLGDSGRQATHTVSVLTS